MRVVPLDTSHKNAYVPGNTPADKWVVCQAGLHASILPWRAGFGGYCLVISLFSLSIWCPASFCQNAQDCLQVSREAAAWLKSIAVTDPSTHSLSWPRSDLSPARMTGMDEGSAGIGEFLLKLYRATLNAQYLQMAEQASNHVYAEYQKGNFNGPDWLAGAAGGGSFFLEIFLTTGDSLYLERAEFAARWLINNAHSDGTGYYWRHSPTFPKLYTGIAHGAGGIGMFFLGLFAETGDSLYLRYAEGALKWAEQFTVKLGKSSIGWKRLTTDSVPYHLWCGGSTGMVFILDSLYRVTGDTAYKTLLAETAAGLRDVAVPNNGGVAWHYTTDDASFPVIYCHGTASTAHALYLAGSTLGDETLVSTAGRGATWLKNVKRSSGSSESSWPHILGWDQYDTGVFTGTASVGHAFVNYYRYDPNPEFLSEAKTAASYLMSVADHPANGQVRWINYTSRDNPDYDVKCYYTGLYSGTAGIATFFLELYQLLNEGGNQGAPSPPSLPTFVTLSNYPNPFNAGTNIVMALSSDETVSLEIFDAIGRRVSTLLRSGHVKQGSHAVTWNGTDDSGRYLPSGVYFAVLRHGHGTVYHKLLLLK